MQKRILKGIALMMALMLVLPMLSLANSTTAEAKTKKKYNTRPTFSITQKTVSEDETFTISLKNLGSQVKKVYWYSQNKKIATVRVKDKKSATVTGKKQGTVSIKCKITYKNGAIVTPSCNVKVYTKATGINIHNADLNKQGFHILEVGDKFNFKAKISPSNSNYKAYWFIDNNAVAKLYSDGSVKGLKAGVVRLTAVAARSSQEAKTSAIRNTVNILVVDDDYDYDDDYEYDDDYNEEDVVKVYVTNVTLKEATKIDISFDRAIDKNTVIGANTALLNSVIITPRWDNQGNLANAPGVLTGTLSEDGKTLSIQSSYVLKGVYEIRLTSSIRSVDGRALKEFVKEYSIYDTKKPRYESVSVDSTGLIATFKFSEAMDFSNMVVADGKAATSGQTLEQTTLNIINTRSNYGSSADRRSLSINLSGIPQSDRNKLLSVRFYSLKDLAGNVIEGDPVAVTFKTNTAYQPQGKIQKIERTDYYYLTVTFDKSIKTPGMAVINNLEGIKGVVDTGNTTKVNYKLSETAAKLTGPQKVSVGYWDAYNVNPNDKYSDTLQEYYVNFDTNNLLPLSAPVFVIQDKDDNSIINVQFSNILDKASAEKISNYSIPGVIITAAELTNYVNSGVVKLKIQAGSIAVSQNYQIGITGVKGYNNSFKEMNPFQAVITLKENKAPELVSYTYYYPTTIMLVFNETITGTSSFKVMQNNADLVLSTSINDKTLLITLKSAPEMGKYMELLPAETNKILDLAGNKTWSILNRYIIPAN
ncbi:Ig-like domain-containing protein [Anaerocolumna sp.]|uniref:Ig-like domain-containing protein n=1 Tax=Anaerocolumna sp. TaxID=2041569 RepID=UPI0028AD3E0A|nr:Ig-like domain-containing protein [Anaerocolumna sp.]